VSILGARDLVVVETDDAVLVAAKDRAQEVKEVVEHLDRANRTEHVSHRRVYRPWGYYESVDAGPGFQVKRLMVKPGHKLSLQLHHQRAEHWVVVSGIARVTRGDDVFELGRNQSTYIPVETKHRLENAGAEPLLIVEVQSGDYLGEDDIVRFEDSYNRDSTSR
jgi:mannose-1-phosphate guanylyltransferase/mannose-6-phosphate isomerase